MIFPSLHSLWLLVGFAVAFPAQRLAAQSFTLTHQGIERTVLLHQATPASAPRAAVIALHGLNQSVASLRDTLRLDRTADREGFIVAYPVAIDLTWNYGRPIYKPGPMVSGQMVDDLGFVRLLIDELVSRKLADPARIYVTGVSRGGLMAFTLACVMADRIAAVAPLITGMTEYQLQDCRPARPAPIMVLAGAADRAQSFGGAQGPLGRLMSVPDTMNFWRQQHGCTGRAARALPHLHADDPTRVLLVEWTGCRTGAAPQLYRVEGGGHQVPSISAGPNQDLRNRDIETADEIWTFFRRFRL